MARVLVLSTTTGYQLRSFGEAAEELGVELAFATDRCHSLDDPWRDHAIAVRFHEEDASLDAILRAAGERPVAGIIALGDRPVVLAARAAEALQVPGNPPEAARASAHKRLARERFRLAGLPVPACASLSVDDDAVQAAAGLRYPVVLKPVALSGSRGVIRADTPGELRAAHARVARLLARPEVRALRTGAGHELLLDEFIEGREYAIEGLLTGGRFTPLALFDKPDPLDGPYFEETIYLTPSAASPAAQQDILAAITKAVRALGLWHGPVHAECRVNARGVHVLEVAARPIGGLCSRVLRFDAAGETPMPEAAGTTTGAKNAGPAPARTCSLEHVLLRHAIGEDMTGVRREASAAGVMMIPIPCRGVFKRVQGADDARRVAHVEDVRITAKPDQRLEPLPEAGSYLGFIFSRAAGAADAEAALRDAYRRLTFVVDPAIDVRARG